MPDDHKPESRMNSDAPDPQPPSDPATPGDGASAAPAGSAPAASEGDARVTELQNLLIHFKADFENYKKRAQKEAASAVRTGELDAVKSFLPVFANLERALAAAANAGESGALVEGVRAIYDQIQSTLTQMGVERIVAVGQPFNPSFHDAVAAASNPDVPPGTVTDEFEPGYKADGRALIPAKVRVSTAE